ncbi:MAG: hypothetical protein K8U03_06200 [Planctomycetia bacterium]|nr:hypothetical protein [Planctomycetia bacterium]
MSPAAQRRRRIQVRRLIDFADDGGRRSDAALVDHSPAVTDQVGFRCDFDAWLRTLPQRERKIVASLRDGESVGTVAQRHRLSSGRISQIRRELHNHWSNYCGGAYDTN